MKIAIDISQVIYGTGVSVYTSELVKNLVHTDKINEYVLFGGSLRRTQELRKFLKSLEEPNVVGKVTPLSPFLSDILWNRLRLGKIELITGKIDLLHTSDWSEPKTNGYKITTIHDFAPLLFPEEMHPRVLEVHKRKLELVKSESDKIIVPSESTKKDAISFGFRENEIVVIPEAARKMFSKAKKQKIDSLKIKYKIEGSYVLSVGAVPRKNIKRALEAFEKIKRELKIDNFVVIGRQYETSEDLGNIIYLGHVPTDDLPGLYSGAEALVYVSLYEGFGLPILEAFNCECPVVASNVSSLPEIAGNAAELVDPVNIDDIAKGISKVIKNSDKYKKLGIKRAGEFSWKMTAENTLKVYNSFFN